MEDDGFRERAASIGRVPPELFEYQRWLAGERKATSGQRDYLFSETKPRFEPRKEDVPVALAGLAVTGKPNAARVRSTTTGVEIPLPGVKRAHAERLLSAMDGERTLLEVGWQAKVEPTVMARFLRATFGRVLMAPAAVVALEQQLSGTEIVRFPCVPYGIDRAYWENMIALRQWFEAERDGLEEPRRFSQLLRELHVIALMGRSLKSFYKPASPVADHTVAPGSWFDDPVRLRPTDAGTIFLDGPRVNASLVGGRGYHEALYDSLGDPGALDDERPSDDGEPSWGKVVMVRSQKDDAPGPWFCPPRPIEDAHLDALRISLHSAMQAAQGGNRDEALSHAAHFHRRFVRLHPFHCANQSLAMTLVGAVLTRSHGAGMPHLLLDHLALRLSPLAYERAFARAAAAFIIDEPNPARRLAILQERAQRSFDIIRKTSAATSAAARRAAIDAAGEAASFALLE